jgi:hypothetical protein
MRHNKKLWEMVWSPLSASGAKCSAYRARMPRFASRERNCGRKSWKSAAAAEKYGRTKAKRELVHLGTSRVRRGSSLHARSPLIPSFRNLAMKGRRDDRIRSTDMAVTKLRKPCCTSRHQQNGSAYPCLKQNEAD